MYNGAGTQWIDWRRQRTDLDVYSEHNSLKNIDPKPVVPRRPCFFHTSITLHFVESRGFYSGAVAIEGVSLVQTGVRLMVPSVTLLFFAMIDANARVYAGTMALDFYKASTLTPIGVCRFKYSTSGLERMDCRTRGLSLTMYR